MKFTFESEGGYISSLKTDSGRDVFLPVFTLPNGKKRGTHACIPYFGPDPNGEKPQHGFGRLAEWQVETSGKDELLAVLTPEEATKFDTDYDQFQAELRLKSSQSHFQIKLFARNQGEKPVAYQPGLHPYFAVTDPDDVWLDEQKLDLSTLAGTEWVSGSVHTLRIGDLALKLCSDMTTWAVWSDNPRYICVEPTICGAALDSVNSDGHVLLNEERANHLSVEFIE